MSKATQSKSIKNEKEILLKYKEILIRTCEMLKSKNYDKKEIYSIIEDVNQNFQQKSEKAFDPIVVTPESFSTKKNQRELYNETNRVLKIVKTRLSRLEKQKEVKLSQSCSLRDIGAYFNTTAQDMVVDFIGIPYQTYSAKKREDKELLLNGALPLQFNPELKGYRLLNLLRAIKYYDDYKSDDLMVSVADFFDNIRIGKILKSVDLTKKTDTIYFKVEKGGFDFDIVELTYGVKVQTKKINISIQKIPDIPKHITGFREVFARHDFEYLKNVNIFKVNQLQLIHNMIEKEVDYDKITYNDSLSLEQSNKAPLISSNSISIIPISRKI